MISSASKPSSVGMDFLPVGAVEVRPRLGCRSINLQWTPDSYIGDVRKHRERVVRGS